MSIFDKLLIEMIGCIITICLWELGEGMGGKK
jgi:hypothetical protein